MSHTDVFLVLLHVSFTARQAVEKQLTERKATKHHQNYCPPFVPSQVGREGGGVRVTY